ncbi:rRNA maturation RNase YbeY [Aureitalea marina]|uniref:Endoribonuclease YbeY n=1 Tax=Aureitalea marina TaxID=930804 RepID=A0A2S7KS70_9FLAO|nr:rRNA maturation RNase YbeY [Aureitalea marina]PQB05466.1 rRNA maturation RNase YbeY [Aureitalea marina]
MIEYNYQKEDFTLEHGHDIQFWLEGLIQQEAHSLGEVSFVFCDDEYLLKINQDFLGHDYYTDIISFDYGLGRQVNGEIYVSIDRVADNAEDLGVEFTNELHRVMAHGILHFLGFKDKSDSEAKEMRKKENEALESRSFI